MKPRFHFSPNPSPPPSVAEVTPGQVVQFERLGYFAADPVEPAVFHRTVGLKDEWANVQKRAK